MTENSNKQTKKRKYFRAKMLRIPPHSFVNKSYYYEEDVWAFSKEGADNKLYKQHKDSYGSHVPQEIVEIAKEDFRGDKVTKMLPDEEKAEDKKIEDTDNSDDTISREMIENGFKTGIISIEESFAGCLGICCRIGDNAFYFAGSEAEVLTKEKYVETFSMGDTIEMLYNILKTAESAEDNGIYEEEYDYYQAVLVA